MTARATSPSTLTAERLAYLGLLLSLALGRLAAALLSVLAPLLRRPADRDLAIFPNAPVGSYGYDVRFGLFLPLLDKEGLRFDVFPTFSDDEVHDAFVGPRYRQYALHSRVFWKRLGQVLRARRHHAVFVQRNLFPFYPDKRTPTLERLLRRLSRNITLDFWDPVHLWQPEVTYASFACADKLCVDNPLLRECYASRHPRLELWPIVIDVSRYRAKPDYALNRPARLLYTGAPANVRAHLEPLLGVLEALSCDFDLELVVIGRYAPRSETVRIRHLAWEESTYYEALASSDLALFPFLGERDVNRLRVAGKTLDYLAAGLPIVGVTEGLAVGVVPGEHMIPVNDTADWPAQLRLALQDGALRERVGRAGRAFMEQHYSVEKSFAEFKRIVFSEPQPGESGKRG